MSDEEELEKLQESVRRVGEALEECKEEALRLVESVDLSDPPPAEEIREKREKMNEILEKMEALNAWVRDPQRHLQ